jgi:hypothetical protein
MREVNKASIAMTLKSCGSMGRGEGSAPDLDAVFAKQDHIHIETDENDPTIHHLHSDGLSSALAGELLKKFGRNELPEKTTPKWKIVSALSLPSLLAFLLVVYLCVPVCVCAYWKENVPPCLLTCVRVCLLPSPILVWIQARQNNLFDLLWICGCLHWCLCLVLPAMLLFLPYNYLFYYFIKLIC